RIVGSIHGALFVIFGMALLAAWIDRRWSFTRPLLVFISSLLPFGVFFMDRSLRAEQLRSS
ncbi:MAG: DUF3817 domain-containing protein, partial [Verrucomicrobiales bacterium]